MSRTQRPRITLSTLFRLLALAAAAFSIASCQRGATPAAGDEAERLVAEGRITYMLVCSACHQMTGQGIPHMFPPLAQSDFLRQDKTRAIAIVLNGLSGPVKVNGERYLSVMPPQRQLSDRQIAGALSFVRSHFGNQLDAVTPEQVATVRRVGPMPVVAGND